MAPVNFSLAYSCHALPRGPSATERAARCEGSLDVYCSFVCNITAAWAVDREFFYIFWVAWAPFASLWLPSGCPWAPLGCPRAALGSPWASLGCPWAHLGCPWAPSQCPWAPSECPWLPLGCAWASFGRPWVSLEIPGGLRKKSGSSTAPAHKI